MHIVRQKSINSSSITVHTVVEITTPKDQIKSSGGTDSCPALNSAILHIFWQGLQLATQPKVYVEKILVSAVTLGLVWVGKRFTVQSI